MDNMSAKKVLDQLGFKPQFVAAGMEGFVFDAGNDLLAKVWIKKSYGEVALLRSFYSQLREKHLPFATPQIQEVLESHDGAVISIEDRLSGVSLKNVLEMNPNNEVLYKKGIDAVLTVVEALGTVGDISIAREFSLLGELSSWTPSSTWNIALAELVDRLVC